MSLKRFLNWEELKVGANYKKEGLIISILKSEGSNAERNYMKHFNINTNVSNTNVSDNNTNVNSNNTTVNNNTNDDNDDSYDGKIRDKNKWYYSDT